MRSKLLSVCAAMLLLAACETGPEESAMSTGTGGQAATTGSGVGSTQTRARSPQEILTSEVGDRVFYAFDKSDLSADARRTVDRWATFLRQHPELTVTIEGHCDERGTREYNLALGERRANSAKNYLVSLGVDARRVATISYGKERPAVVGSNEAAWSQNRRAVMVVN